MSKRIRKRESGSDPYHSEFERALEETEHRKTDRGRRVEQKTRQLCQQARRALNFALAAHSVGGALDGVLVIEVSAAAGCGRLVAHVAVPAGHPVSDALKELRDRAPRLRAVVAGYISRKRAPEVSFVVAPLWGDSHE